MGIWSRNRDLYDRWSADVTADDASQDYRNGPNTFGWIVEIDPVDSRQNPVKRTALGRFAHEDCRASRAREDDNLFLIWVMTRVENIFISLSLTTNGAKKDRNRGYAAGDKYMDHGKLYAAKFNADGAVNGLS